MSKYKFCIVILVLSILSTYLTAPTQARAQSGWSQPYRLSSEAGKSSEGYLVADSFGYVHCFWTETLFENGNWVIKYARFDGTTWSKPNDIYIAELGIRNVSPSVDRQGNLHIAWAEGLVGPAYHTYAPANNALSAQNWAKPFRINIPARTVYLRVDSQGIYHLLFINQAEEAGVYYVRSEDGGNTWSVPEWLDPDIPPDHIPDSLNFELDEKDGLHAAWFYGTRTVGATPDWVRYTHSLDGGNTWSVPFTIDQHIEGSDHNLTTASPIMAVQGQTVHVVWAAGSLPYRNHRYSTDAGDTWSAPVQIFGDLHGQAFDGLAVDRSGRVHFFGQIRYPMGIYHAYWDQTRWSKPSLVYLIAEEGSEGFGDRVHAHHTLPVIRAGNQLILTFADGPADPNRRLFVVTRTLDDVLPLVNTPPPAATETPLPQSEPTSLSLIPNTQRTTPTPNTDSAVSRQVEPVSSPDLAIQLALIPTLLFLGAAMFWQWYKRKP